MMVMIRIDNIPAHVLPHFCHSLGWLAQYCRQCTWSIKPSDNFQALGLTSSHIIQFIDKDY